MNIDVLDQIADDVSSSGAQKKAAREALARYNDLVSIPARQDDEPLIETTEKPRLSVDTDFVAFVLNGAGAADHEAMAMRSFIKAMLERGTVTVVTVGRMGVEIEAAKLSKGLGLRHIEVGAVWQRPNPDGSTTRVPAARNVRNKVLRDLVRDCVASGVKPVVLRYGTETRGDIVENLLVEAGAKARPGSHLFVPKAEAKAAPVVTEA